MSSLEISCTTADISNLVTFNHKKRKGRKCVHDQTNLRVLLGVRSVVVFTVKGNQDKGDKKDILCSSKEEMGDHSLG